MSNTLDVISHKHLLNGCIRMKGRPLTRPGLVPECVKYTSKTLMGSEEVFMTFVLDTAVDALQSGELVLGARVMEARKEMLIRLAAIETFTYT
jgi:hypothetical protein